MIKKYRPVFFILLAVAAGLLVTIFLRGSDIAVLQPKGPIAGEQRDLMIISTLLMLVVVLPVFIMTFAIVWKYREGNTKKNKVYRPDWDGNRKLELAWWALPALIITVLGVLIHKSSHDLDPFKALASNKKPVTVQVVALQWKWLFIYPEQGIATVNELRIPEDTPINFEITADAPMNSFWIPKLGGQVYAMAGMRTKLHLMATDPGNYVGSSANLSGEGFSKMRFTTIAQTEGDFNSWLVQAKASPGKLSLTEYSVLAKPNLDETTAVYSSIEKDLLHHIVDKYMKPVAEEGSEGARNHSAH